MNALDIDPDIRRARTLPSEVYYSPEWFARQQQRVFRRGWHLFPGHADAAEQGALRPFRIGDAPVFLSRGADRLRCLSNVCTHRGSLLVREPCRAQSIRCAYHGRRFSLDGSFRSMPLFETAENFPTTDDDLPEVACETWGPLAFASLDPEHRFDQLIAPVIERLSFFPVDELRLDAVKEYEFEANWALYLDNALEGFHIPYVHPTLNKALDMSRYDTELFPYGSLQIGVAEDDEVAFEVLDQGRRVGGYYFWLFPTTMLNFYPWGVSVNAVVPVGPTRTRVVYMSYESRPDLRHRGAGAGLHEVELEDEAVVIDCQKGVMSPLYDRGRYSPAHERSVHHFHRLLAQFSNSVD